LLLSCVLLLFSCDSLLTAAEPRRDPAQWIKSFSTQWDDTAWNGFGSGRTKAYIRPMDDEGWKARMHALAGLVSAGQKSVEPLIDLLSHGKPAERVLAAQALGYLAAEVPSGPLLAAAQDDAEAAVRLYAVDALGMQGNASLHGSLEKLLETESSGDVKKHIGYALARGEHGVDRQVLEQFVRWNPKTLDSARLGKQAPDFALPSLDGETIRLSDFRGKQAVVLVFIYGDT